MTIGLLSGQKKQAENPGMQREKEMVYIPFDVI